MSLPTPILARVLATTICGWVFLCAHVDKASAEPLQFNRDIRPILSDRCFKCHGPDKASRKGDLRLDTPEGAYAERPKSHEHAVVPGKPEESVLCRKIFAA
ncbi:MAG TPA: c-type cytochrome domain-containing protein, partial [Verrucomicrobiae bacterium]|nr:c-type cytochrome domain-containing protein [Verrucomicrobiae bacterium]